MIQIETYTHEPFQVNSYLVWSDEPDAQSAILINAGNGIDAIVARCTDLNRSLDSILHTHGFLEYMQGQPPLRDHYDLTAYMSPMDEFWIAHFHTQATILGINEPPMAFIEQQINPNETFTTAGLKVIALHTPGTTPGSISYYIPEAKAVFTGDALFAGYIGATDVPHGNREQLIQSIEAQLWTLPDDTAVYPGRGRTTTIGDEKTKNPLQCIIYGKPFPVPQTA